MPIFAIHAQPLHCRDVGEGVPILFGHGYLWDGTLWNAQVDALSETHRCIVPDLWGHGRSGALPPSTRTMKDLARDMLALADTLRLDDFVVCGHGIGGQWALELALMAPRRVKGLVLIGTFAGAESERARNVALGLLESMERSGGMTPPILDALLPYFFTPEMLEEDGPVVRAFRMSLLRLPPERLATVLELGRMICLREDRMHVLPALASRPVLVIAGQEDRRRPREEGRRMAAALGVRCEEIPGAGHVPPLEQPVVMNRLLRDFLVDCR